MSFKEAAQATQREIMRVMKRMYVDPCLTCEHAHGKGCPECPNKTRPITPRYQEGKLVIASGEDANVFS